LKEDLRERLYIVNLDDFLKSEQAGREYEPPTTGHTPYDRHWYCEPCERVFSVLDNFAATFLRSEVGLGHDLPIEPNVRIADGAPTGVLGVRSRHAWKWLSFLLSIAYRVHMSGYGEYSEIDLGEQNMSEIRGILLRGGFTRALFENYDIVSFIVQRGSHLEGNCLPPRGKTLDGGFLVYWSIWGVWAFVGKPRPQFEFGKFIPYNQPDKIHFAVISSDLHIDLMMKWGGARKRG
jgi:hypothetical protein